MGCGFEFSFGFDPRNSHRRWRRPYCLSNLGSPLFLVATWRGPRGSAFVESILREALRPLLMILRLFVVVYAFLLFSRSESANALGLTSRSQFSRKSAGFEVFSRLFGAVAR